jgi:urease accessory protein UreH
LSGIERGMRPQSANQLPDYQITRLPDCRAPAAIGRSARLELVFEVRGGRTILAHSYAEPPFRVGRAFALGDAAYVIVVCSGPGVFGGDSLRQSIRVAAGARAVLTSQSALQVHPSAGSLSTSPAVVHHTCVVEEDAELHCHWDPVIPFAASRLEQRFEIQIAGSSRLYWSDAMMAGRVSRGEAWRFASLAHALRLRVDASLAYLERYTLTPADRAPQRTWMAGEASYLATALVRHPDVTSERVEALYRSVAAHAGVDGGVDLVAPRLAVARLMARDGASFSRARASYREMALRSIFGGPELATRK